MHRIRIGLRARLEARLPEIERAVVARVHGIEDTNGADPVYTEGLRSAVPLALEYGLEAIERGEGRVAPPPPALLVQARMAARSGVGLDTVLRRYFAGYNLFGEFIVAEVERGLLGGATPSQIHRDRAAVFDRLLAAISEEYARESKSQRPRTPDQRRAEIVRRLLASEPVESSELAYDLDGFHLGIVSSGNEVVDALRDVSSSLDRRLLIVSGDGTSLSAWLGGNHPLDPMELKASLSSLRPCPAAAIGESAEGLVGWRLTHRQATAALPISRCGEERVVRYRDVGLLASTFQDDTLSASLRQIYLSPLEHGRNRGCFARETLRAYFATAGNIASAAHVLGISRQAASSRIRKIEEALGQPLGDCMAELALALRLDELDSRW
jgi:PucR C-terminal helix-turn-helix domain